LQGFPKKTLIVVGIETSGAVGSVALLKGDQAEERSFGERLQHARDLLPALAELLNSCGLSPKDVDLLAVANGPGSYTGLRVGVATARAMAYALRKPIVGISTLEALARNVQDAAETICTLLDAKRREVYVQLFRRETEGLKAASPPSVLRPEAASEMIPRSAVLLGDALHPYGEFFLKKGFNLAPEDLWRPRASVVAELGEKFFAEHGTNDVHSLVPVYLRRPAAEEKRLGKT